MEPRISVRSVKYGWLKLEDGTVIVQRVAVVDVSPVKIDSPFGVDFDVVVITGISPHPSRKVVDELKNKPMLKLAKNHPMLGEKSR